MAKTRRYLNKRSNTYVTRSGKTQRFSKNISIKNSLRTDKRRRAKKTCTKVGVGNSCDWRRKI